MSLDNHHHVEPTGMTSRHAFRPERELSHAPKMLAAIEGQIGFGRLTGSGVEP
jgi:hypothetical protein